MSLHETDIFIDLQGYNCSFGYMLKELAIYDGTRSSNYLFKPPFNKQMLSIRDEKVVNWSENYHGLEWNSGYTDLNEIEDILKHVLRNYISPKIYVKGLEKSKFLKRFLEIDCVYNIPNEREPILSKFKKIPECYFHKDINPWHCALANAKLLYNYRNC